MKRIKFLGMVLALLFAIVFLGTGALGATPDTANSAAQVTVTVSGRGQQTPPRLTSRDVVVYENNQRRPVLDLTPLGASAKGSDLVILIDGSLRSNVALQFNDLRSFIDSLPASTFVGVAYSEYGAARFTQKFTRDREAVKAALRLPEGRINVGGSIYQSITELARHWSADGRARSALVVSDGLDINRGLSETLPTLNPDLAEAIAQSQRAGVSVYAIYANGATGLTRNLSLLNNAQGSLSRLGSETGGEAYFQGDETPVSFSPFLNRIRESLSRQYILTFEAAPNADQGSLRITTEVPHVRISAPARIWLNQQK